MKIYLKLIYLPIIFLLAGNLLFAQSIYVVGPTNYIDSIDIKDDWSISLHSTIGNKSNSDINVKVMVKVQVLPVGHSFDVCWKGNCLPATTEDWDKADPEQIKAGTVLPENSFFSHYYCQDKGSDPLPGTGKLLYTFYNVDNPADKAEIMATFLFTNKTSVSEFISNPTIDIKQTQDNILNISTEKSERYQLNIYSINGNLVLSSSFELNSYTDLNTLSNGVYIFNLIDSHGNKAAIGKISL
jgi:hypothetical protein